MEGRTLRLGRSIDFASILFPPGNVASGCNGRRSANQLPKNYISHISPVGADELPDRKVDAERTHAVLHNSGS